MADLTLTVDYSQLKAANKEITKTGGAAQKSASVFETAFKKVEAQQKKALNDVRQQLAFSKRLEAQKQKEAQAAAQSAALVQKQEERLRHKYVEGYTAMNIYSKELNDLAVARKKDIITAEQQEEAVKQLNAQMAAGTGVFANAATGMQVVGKKANRTGVLAQQAGYQFGDFAVQVQSGTDPMVAFGQQATQLIGTFSMLAKTTKGIAIFSALGVLVPVLTAVGGALIRLRKEAKAFSDGLPSVKEAVKSVKGEIKDLNSEISTLVSGLQSASEASLVQRLTELRLRQSQLGPRTGEFINVRDEIKDVEELLQKLRGTREERERITDVEKLTNAELKAGLSLQESIQEKNKQLYDDIVAGLQRIKETPIYEPFDITAQRLEESKNKIIGVIENANKLKKQLGEAAYEALRIAGVDLSSPLDKATIAAAKLAGELGLSLEIAAAIAEIGKPKGPDKSVILDPRDPNYDPEAARLEKLRQYIREGFRGEGTIADKSEGKSEEKTAKSKLQRLKEQLSLQEKLRGQTLVEQQLIKSLGAEYGKLDAGVLEGLRKRIIEQEEYNKVVAQQEEIANTIAGGFGDAFMSIVDGTKSAKEAFSDMARHIIARLFEILVIEQMVQSIAGAISGSFGGVPRTAVDGTPVPPTRVYDGGGYTGSGSRSGGLDGRGGFMAMLHPRETVVDHTKPNQAMSQQPVVINQSFNFAANGDDSVKRIIAQEAPKIARMTQQQILDQRRRGGQMKAAFS